MPATSGMLTWGGPLETCTVTTSPLVIGLPAPGDWPMIVPCAALLDTVCCCSWYPPDCASPCAAENCWPTKFGSGGPALTVMPTGLACGQEVPATGLVLITTPTGMVSDAAVVTDPGVRPAFFSSAWAAASVSPVTCGTPIMTGPVDSMSVTVAPRLALVPLPGSVAATSPLATVLLCSPWPTFTVKPRFCSSERAVPTAMPVTWGTVANCPSVTHQATRPMITAAAMPRLR